MLLRKTIHALIYPGEEGGFVAECVEIGVVTQGKTLDETLRNLKDAVQLFFEGEDIEEMGFVRNPILNVHLEVEMTDDQTEAAS